MALPTPVLDDRRFQDIVTEARALIPRYCPEWTDHNLSDPGITLIELFAWMTDILLYRLNKVPDKNYVKFMELIGVRLQPPSPAKVGATFWLSAPQPSAVTIARGTEVATIRTETQDAITFTTDRDLIVVVPKLALCWTTADGQRFVDQTPRLDLIGERFMAFGTPPQPEQGMYLGYPQDLSGNILSLAIDATIEGIGVDPKNPPLAWEAWQGEEIGWMRCDMERDTTGGLNRRGEVVLHVPAPLAPLNLSGKTAYWVRCRLIPARPGQPTYSASPQIDTIRSTTLGGTAPATHAVTRTGELLGRSDGTPGQTIQLEAAPVLPRREQGETLESQREDGGWDTWEEVDDFADSGPHDRHYVLDSVTGTLQLGPAVRYPDGTERLHGVVPPKGAMLRFTSYRIGGGTIGNVGTHTLTVLKSSIPYVARVTNRYPAIGGVDAESLDAAKLRAPKMLRTRHRAVTAEDYEYLARESTPSVARAKCIQATGSQGGAVRVVIIPAAAPVGGRTPLAGLQVNTELVRQVTDYLDERRLLTVPLAVEAARYLSIAVATQIIASEDARIENVKDAVEEALYQFLDPLRGGPQGDGWPFGRTLHVSEVYARIQRVPGVDYAEAVGLYQVNPATGERVRVDPRLTVPEDAVVVSAEHIVQVRHAG